MRVSLENVNAPSLSGAKAQSKELEFDFLRVNLRPESLKSYLNKDRVFDDLVEEVKIDLLLPLHTLRLDISLEIEINQPK